MGALASVLTERWHWEQRANSIGVPGDGERLGANDVEDLQEEREDSEKRSLLAGLVYRMLWTAGVLGLSD